MDSNSEDSEFDESQHNFEVTNEGLLCLTMLSIGNIPETVFSMARAITKLDLSHNHLEALPDRFCIQLQALKKLILQGNSLDALPNNIGLLKELQELSVNENRLKGLPRSVGGLLKLEILHLNANLIKALPEELSELLSLKELTLDENKLEYLPKNFGHLINLEQLECSYNCIAVLPEDVGNLIKLRILDLSSNKKLDSLPKSFADLPSLEILDLSDNRLTSLPVTLKSCDKLTTLTLDTNELSDLPIWMNNMPNILEISLKGNFVNGTALNEDFGLNNIKLRRFDISGNLMQALPESLARIETLVQIDMGSTLFEPERKKNLRNGNNILFLPKHFGEHFYNLHELRIDECGIDELPAGFGNGLANLVVFDSHCNNLRELPESFCLLAKLQFCTISMNELKRLPDRIGDLHALKELHLENNQVWLLVSLLITLISCFR